MAKWQPLQLGNAVVRNNARKHLMRAMDKVGVTGDERARMIDRHEASETWLNSTYVVTVDRMNRTLDQSATRIVHLSIRRQDRTAKFDWRDMQRIKNQLVGENHEGIQLFPSEQRLVDTANQFHLWVFAEPDKAWPVGFGERDVQDAEAGTPWTQRPFHPKDRPDDA